jgi:hypothetical protein
MNDEKHILSRYLDLELKAKEAGIKVRIVADGISLILPGHSSSYFISSLEGAIYFVSGFAAAITPTGPTHGGSL